MRIFSIKSLALLPKDLESVSSSKQYYALIYLILKEYKDVKNSELEFKDVLEKLKKVADDNFEEGDYLIGEIQELTGEVLDDHFLSLFNLKK